MGEGRIYGTNKQTNSRLLAVGGGLFEPPECGYRPESAVFGVFMGSLTRW